MMNPVTEPVDETADALWADDELSDEALDRAGGREGKALSGAATFSEPCR